MSLFSTAAFIVIILFRRVVTCSESDVVSADSYSRSNKVCFSEVVCSSAIGGAGADRLWLIKLSIFDKVNLFMYG
ncbi:hypothetical protein [Candidatus Bodocaedibacter vickermanii]